MMDRTNVSAIEFHQLLLNNIIGLLAECWPGLVKCDGCRCVSPAEADIYCLDRQGALMEKICNTRPHTKFRCENGICVLLKWILDGRNDCGDFSDESTHAITSNFFS